MAKRKKDPIREIHHPDGRTEVEYMDGTSAFIDSNGNPIRDIVISDHQLEAWRKEPKEQALKEALELFKSQGMDVAEQRIKLDIIKFISEIQGVSSLQPLQQQNIMSIQINVADAPPGFKVNSLRIGKDIIQTKSLSPQDTI